MKRCEGFGAEDGGRWNKERWRKDVNKERRDKIGSWVIGEYIAQDARARSGKGQLGFLNDFCMLCILLSRNVLLCKD